jgi:DNA-binding Lrp family transcriptional regulator
MGEGARRGVDDVQDRVTIQEAARRLGISEGAVRKRVTRGTLEHAKEDDGRVYVYLDRDRHRVDDVQDTGVDPNSSALISRLEDEIAYLREESRRKDEIIMQQAVSMRQLTAAAVEEPTQDAQAVEEEPERAEPRSYAAGPQEGAQRPWWRRIFGRA